MLGLFQPRRENPPTLSKHDAQRLQGIIDELSAYSSQLYPVFIAPTPNSGMAMDGGKIILDPSLFQEPHEVLVAVLAHEWGHFYMNHFTTPYNQGRTYLPLDFEDQADWFGMRFLASHGYELEPVLTFTEKFRGDRFDRHSQSVERCENLKRWYQERLDELGIKPTIEPKIEDIKSHERKEKGKAPVLAFEASTDSTESSGAHEPLLKEMGTQSSDSLSCSGEDLNRHSLVRQPAVLTGYKNRTHQNALTKATSSEQALNTSESTEKSHGKSRVKSASMSSR